MSFSTPVIIVAFRNPGDVVGCLDALRQSAVEPSFNVYICENGGTKAFDDTIAALTAAGGPCLDEGDVTQSIHEDRFIRVRSLRMRDRASHVFIAEAKENYGYAGAINAWISVLLKNEGWRGLWVLNPDTQPDANALAELVAWAAKRNKGMVGSRIVPFEHPDLVHARGLSIRYLQASTGAVDYHASAASEPDADALEARIDAPYGSSFYVTRPCIEKIGLMDERFFLYYEVLDWGYRAKLSDGIGYAFGSIVRHRGGTTIGSNAKRTARSRLAVYLEFRNRILFVRKYNPIWLPWTVLALLGRSALFAGGGAFSNMGTALRGILMGVLGETGRPESIMSTHR